MLLLLGALTWRQGAVYRDAETLWQDTIAKNPSAWAAQNNLGLILARRGEAAQAEARYREALRLDPGFIEAHNNLGSLLSRQGRNEEAAAQFAEAVRLKPDYPVARLNLATALLKLNRNREAIEQLDEVLRQEPELLPAHERRAAALEREGRSQEALAEQVEVLRLRAWIRATHEDGSIRNAGEAIRYASQACELTGSAQPRPLDALAAAYAEAGRFSDAVATARKALALAESAGQEELAARAPQADQVLRGGPPVARSLSQPHVQRIARRGTREALRPAHAVPDTERGSSSASRALTMSRAWRSCSSSRSCPASRRWCSRPCSSASAPGCSEAPSPPPRSCSRPSSEGWPPGRRSSAGSPTVTPARSGCMG